MYFIIIGRDYRSLFYKFYGQRSHFIGVCDINTDHNVMSYYTFISVKQISAAKHKMASTVPTLGIFSASNLE